MHEHDSYGHVFNPIIKILLYLSINRGSFPLDTVYILYLLVKKTIYTHDPPDANKPPNETFASCAGQTCLISNRFSGIFDAAYFSTPVHFVFAISSARLRQELATPTHTPPPCCCSLNSPSNGLLGMVMLARLYQGIYSVHSRGDESQGGSGVGGEAKSKLLLLQVSCHFQLAWMCSL